jgi:hypothetical protein
MLILVAHFGALPAVIFRGQASIRPSSSINFSSLAICLRSPVASELCATLHDDLSNLSFSRLILSHLYTYIRFPFPHSCFAPLQFLSVRNLSAYSIKPTVPFNSYLFVVSYAFIRMPPLPIVLPSLILNKSASSPSFTLFVLTTAGNRDE